MTFGVLRRCVGLARCWAWSVYPKRTIGASETPVCTIETLSRLLLCQGFALALVRRLRLLPGQLFLFRDRFFGDVPPVPEGLKRATRAVRWFYYKLPTSY